MSFKTWGTLSPNEGQMIRGGDTVPEKTIIANDEVMQIGEARDRLLYTQNEGFYIGRRGSTIQGCGKA